MDPGELAHRVVLQSKTVGGEVITWTDEATTWARARPLTGRELIAAQAMHAEANMEFTIRYRKAVQAAWRLEWQGRHYDIQEVQDVEGAGRFHKLICSQGLRDG